MVIQLTLLDDVPLGSREWVPYLNVALKSWATCVQQNQRRRSIQTLNWDESKS